MKSYSRFNPFRVGREELNRFEQLMVAVCLVNSCQSLVVSLNTCAADGCHGGCFGLVFLVAICGRELTWKGA